MFHTYYPTDKLMSHQLQMQNIYLCLHSKLKMKLVIEPIIIRIAKQSEEEETSASARLQADEDAAAAMVSKFIEKSLQLSIVAISDYSDSLIPIWKSRILSSRLKWKKKKYIYI